MNQKQNFKILWNKKLIIITQYNQLEYLKIKRILMNNKISKVFFV